MSKPFNPSRGTNQRVTATATATTLTVTPGTHSLRILNEGDGTVFFTTYKASDQTLEATVNDTPVGKSGSAGCVLVVKKPIDHDTISIISATGDQTVNFQIGEDGY